MGTRNLTCVVLDGKYKVAQYGQWDGYPASAGVTVYEFLKKMMEITHNGAPANYLLRFYENLRKCRFISDDELQKLWVECGATPGSDTVGMDVADKFKGVHPTLSRDTGAGILNVIFDTESHVAYIPLTNAIEFANEGLFCEWVYLLDLDTHRLKVYRGQHEEPHLASGRFPGQVLLWDCVFADLPSKPENFVAHLDALADKSRKAKKKVAK